MDMMTSAFLSIAITTLSVTVITSGIEAVARWKFRRPVARKRTRPEFRRQATRIAEIPGSSRRIQAQYLPELARARILRARTAYLGITTSRRRQVGRAALPESAPTRGV